MRANDAGQRRLEPALEPMSKLPSTDVYAGYELWKKWDRPFSYSEDEAAYYKGEMRGLEIGGADVLEIGFGAGGFIAWARDCSARVVGVEIIPALAEAARARNIELLPPEFEGVTADHTGRFDTIVAFDVFEHFTLDVVTVRLKACETMLKGGGHLILRFPNGQSPFGLAPQNGDPTHRSILSRGVFEQLTQGMGLRVVRYAPSFRVRGGGFGKRLARNFRYFIRDLIAKALNFIYAQEIPWDPVVVLVLRKSGNIER